MKTIRKITIAFIMCIIFFNVNAQTNYNGWYQNQFPDINIGSAITNFVSGRMLIIDTYQQQAGANPHCYLKLTFIDDFFNPLSTEIIDNSFGYDFITINDVKYDVVNNLYVACGTAASTNGGYEAIIMCFDNFGNVIWSRNAWDNTIQGPSNYLKVEIINFSPGVGYYAACGYGNTISALTGGVVGFYDIGNIINNNNINPNYMYYIPNFPWFTSFSSMVFNPTINQFVVAGNGYIGSPGILAEVFNVAPLIITPPLTQFYLINGAPNLGLNVTSITKDNTNNRYFVVGDISDNNGSDIFAFELTNIANKGRYHNPFTTTIHSRDMCFNPNTNPMGSSPVQLGVTGWCFSNNNFWKEGFLYELDANNLASPISLGFSLWSGHQGTSNDDEWFDHIVYRHNTVTPFNYSYIMHGEYELLYNRSCIAEYYPVKNHTNICQEMFHDYQVLPLNTTPWLTPSILNITPNLPQFFYTINPDINILLPVCEPQPFYSNVNNHGDKNAKLISNNPDYINENGIIKLNDDYKNTICKLYSIDGKLIYTKLIGISTISDQNLPNGMYLLQPIGNFNLKTIKFVISH